MIPTFIDELLGEVFTHALEGSQIVAVSGPQGIGKTWSAVKFLRTRRLQVSIGVVKDGKMSAYQLLADAFGSKPQPSLFTKLPIDRPSVKVTRPKYSTLYRDGISNYCSVASITKRLLIIDDAHRLDAKRIAVLCAEVGKLRRTVPTGLVLLGRPPLALESASVRTPPGHVEPASGTATISLELRLSPFDFTLEDVRRMAKLAKASDEAAGALVAEYDAAELIPTFKGVGRRVRQMMLARARPAIRGHRPKGIHATHIFADDL